MNKSEAGKLGNLKSRITQQKQKQERIDCYNKNPKLCAFCGKALSYNERHKKFCNSSCAASYNNKIRKRKYVVKQTIINKKIHYVRDYGTCLYCGKPLKRKGKYCNNACMGKYVSETKYQKEIEQWKAGTLVRTYNTIGNVIKSIKKYLLQKYNYRCAKCGWGEINPYTGRLPLEVHHVDGNWQNNTEDNLVILCPNCHSLTPTYKALNKGNGRQSRHRQNKDNNIQMIESFI